MSGVAIVTDSNSGITQEEAKRLGIFVLPMPFYIDGELFYEDIKRIVKFLCYCADACAGHGW